MAKNNWRYKMTIPEIENGVQTTNTLSNNLAKITKFG